MVCPIIREIFRLLKIVDYLLVHVQADKTWYNYNIYYYREQTLTTLEKARVITVTDFSLPLQNLRREYAPPRGFFALKS